MKCTNPNSIPKCQGEFGTYPGIAPGKIECKTCGYRIDASAEQAPAEQAPVTTDAPKKSKTSTDKEN